MIQIRPSSDRGSFDHGWLKARHTFSFARYFDRNHMGFRALRVINEDVVAPGMGFDTHPHDNMEIVTYILSGQLAHRDSMGNLEVLGPGEIQRMSAGTGIEHSEFNPSPTEPVHLLQIWLKPAELDTAPSYQQQRFSDTDRHNRLGLIVSPDGESGSVRIGQDVRLYTTVLDPGARVSLPIKSGRHAWVQIVRGGVHLNGHALRGGDGAAVSNEAALELACDPRADSPAEVLVFDLA